MGARLPGCSSISTGVNNGRGHRFRVGRLTKAVPPGRPAGGRSSRQGRLQATALLPIANKADPMTEDELPDWDWIVEHHARRVFRVALRILKSVQDAEDVSQDVFAEAFRLHGKGRVASWTGLLVRLASLRSLDRLRRNRPAVELRDDDRVVTSGPPEEAGARELADWLRKAVAGLPDQQATVFVMHYFEQLSRDEIAAALGVSSDAVSTALYKARQRLQAQLAVADEEHRQ